MYAYTYTLLRYVHDIATREFVTVGVVLHSSEAHFIGAKFKKSYGRIKDLFPGFEADGFRVGMAQLERAFTVLGGQESGELQLREFKDALHVGISILPKDDSAMQWAELRSGITSDPQAELETLYDRLVSYYDDKPNKRGRNDEQVWGSFRSVLHQRNLLSHLTTKIISTDDDEIVFDNAIKNGVWHCFEPVSLDLVSKESIKEKAYKVLGRITSLNYTQEDIRLYLLLGAPQDRALLDTFNHMVSLLKKTGSRSEVVFEEHALRIAEVVEQAACHSEAATREH